jgi:hypothetical protein
MKTTLKLLLFAALILVAPAITMATGNGHNGHHNWGGGHHGGNHSGGGSGGSGGSGGYGGGHGGGWGGGGCNSCGGADCGGSITAKYCFDQNKDASCTSADTPIELSSSNSTSPYRLLLYSEYGDRLKVAIPGAEGTPGTAKFSGLKPGTYMVCAEGVTNGGSAFTYPSTATYEAAAPSSRVDIVENLNAEGVESPYCFEVEIGTNCPESIKFAYEAHDW